MKGLVPLRRFLVVLPLLILSVCLLVTLADAQGLPGYLSRSNPSNDCGYPPRFRQSLFACRWCLRIVVRGDGGLQGDASSSGGNRSFLYLKPVFWGDFRQRYSGGGYRAVSGRGRSICYRPISRSARWVLNANHLRVLATLVAPHLRRMLMARFLRDAMTRGPVPVLI